MKSTAAILALALLATGAALATPGAVPFQCDGFPPNPERAPQCAESMLAWAQKQVDDQPNDE